MCLLLLAQKQNKSQSADCQVYDMLQELKDAYSGMDLAWRTGPLLPGALYAARIRVCKHALACQ